MKGAGLLLLSLLLLSACAGRESRDTAPGGAQRERAPSGTQRDGAPAVGSLDLSRIEQPVPRPEPRSPYGNHSPYTVLGQTYRVLPTADGYHERGIASWYGTKFHGRPTSSGEPYDLYKMTAAHRSLPLPTYAEVTHLGNGRKIIVRINDRGPFHDDRIIDLSYAAAVKLNMAEAGTAPVEVRTITFDEPLIHAISPARVPVLLQVGAFADRDRAQVTATRLQDAGINPVRTEQARTGAGRVWRVQVGPLSQAEQAMDMVEKITGLGLGRPQYVYP